MRLHHLLLAFVTCAGVYGQSLSPAWVELGPGGQVLARIIVANAQDCPAIKIGTARQKMTLRQPVPEGLQPACEFVIPTSAKSASVNGQKLALPPREAKRVAVIGDTGCRVKGARVQSCNDPAEWPFLQVAVDVAAEKPDLVIHVGDYLYRESPCPVDAQAKCGGTPSGDNWGAWNADFFTPAAKLLAAAPWAFSRGNHEDCKRSWRGWFYYLDPRPLSANWQEHCEIYSRPYIATVGKSKMGKSKADKSETGGLEMAMLDSAPVVEDVAEEKQVAEYAKQLEYFQQNLRGDQAWLVDHHPFWGMKTGVRGKAAASLSVPLEEAWDRAAPQKFSLILSGHIHLFELFAFDHNRPPQLVAGDAGTDLAEPIKTTTKGVVIDSATIMSGESQHQFGFTLLTRTSHNPAWELTLKNRERQVVLHCSLTKNQATCEKTPLAGSE